MASNGYGVRRRNETEGKCRQCCKEDIFFFKQETAYEIGLGLVGSVVCIRDSAWSVHGSIFAYGIGLLDNALLQPLAEACAEEGRYEFMLTVNPLRVVGGTGSPVNPVAIL